MVRVRFAPSPTGPLHIGGVRTALYNYLFAKKQDGKFILRIEDTDSQRFVAGAEEYIVETFRWLNIPFDEGPHLGGPFGPYRQSERKAIYREYVDRLLERGLAYLAFDTPEELELKRKEIPNFQYDASTRMMMNNSLTMTPRETDARLRDGQQYVVRMKIAPDQIVVVDDLIRGEVRVHSSIIDDKALFKSADQLPTYHLANIVDDHRMEITHVIRGEEWLPSAALHVLLYRYLGWENAMPRFAHLPLLLKPEGNGKLSKRDGDRLGFPVFPLQWQDPKTGDIFSGYREKGYLPEAVVNFLVLQGWNPGDDREIMSLDEIQSLFSLEKCSKSGAKFDYRKGIWFNHQYIQLKSNEAIADRFVEANRDRHPLARYSPEQIAQIVGLVKDRIHFIDELWDQTAYFFVAPETYDEKAVQKRWKEETPAQLTELAGVLLSLSDFTSRPVEATVIHWIESQAYHLGNIMNAFRLALVGESKGPHLFDIVELLGKEEVIRRIEKAVREIPAQRLPTA